MMHRRLLRLSIGMGLVLGVTAACGESAGPRTGGNSNWLTLCSTDEDCGGDHDCVCGVCTPPCDSSASCSGLDGAVCAVADQPAAWAQCQTTTAATGICLMSCQPGDCQNDRTCIDGACVTLALPTSDFCAAVAEPEAAARQQEEELLALLQAARTEGVQSCSGVPPQAVPALRADGRSVCAARVLAADLAITRSDNLVDSAGRNTLERLALAGYTATTWGESVAFALGAPAAFGIMLSGADSCPPLFDATATEVGIGCVEDACVVTLATNEP